MLASAQRLLESWKIEQRVIAALLMREIMTRFGRHNLGFLWLFVEPMIFTVGVTALWTATRALHGSNLPIVPFAVTGYSSVLLWRNMPARTIGAVDPNRTLLYHRNVKVLDIYLARLLLEASGATISFIVLTLFFWSLGWMHGPEDVLQIAEAWFLLALFGAGLAVFLGSLSEEFEIIEKLWHPVTYLFFPLSGAAYIVSSLPLRIQPMALSLPMVNGVEMLREGYFGSEMTAIYNVPYFVCSIMLLWCLGLLQLRKISKRAIAG